MTTTIVTPDLDTEILEDLDFDHELPCELYDGNPFFGWQPCSSAATWIVDLAAHCKRSRSVTKIICDRHYERLVNSVEGVCADCGNIYVVRELILRLERIKP